MNMNRTTLLILLALAGCSPEKKETKTETEAAAVAPQATAAALQSKAVNDVLEPAEFKKKLPVFQSVRPQCCKGQFVRGRQVIGGHTAKPRGTVRPKQPLTYKF